MFKKNKNINILLIVILIITMNLIFILNGCNGANAVIEENQNITIDDGENSLKNIYQSFVESERPSILVFSYDADCCASTRAFFDNYNGMAKKLLDGYKSKFNTLFINTGILDKDNMNTLLEIATENQVLNLPSILILDKDGKAYKVIEGLFNEAEVKQILDKV